MSTDYAKKKNAELEDLLKARSLPHTGKKADLIARLVEDDKKHQSSKSKSSAPAANEDEIDWEDDAATATASSTTIPKAATEPSAAAIAAGGQGQVPNPTAVPNQVVDFNPATTSDLAVKPPADANGAKRAATTTTTEASKPDTKPTPTDFTSGISATSIETELEKRRKRAARFGLVETNEDAIKALERAKKFGTGIADDKVAVKGLDEALPESLAGKKRGRGGDDGGRGKRRRSDERNRSRGPRKNGGGGERGAASGYSEKDRLAAEARKKRFTAAA